MKKDHLPKPPLTHPKKIEETGNILANYNSKASIPSKDLLYLSFIYTTSDIHGYLPKHIPVHYFQHIYQNILIYSFPPNMFSTLTYFACNTSIYMARVLVSVEVCFFNNSNQLKEIIHQQLPKKCIHLTSYKYA